MTRSICQCIKFLDHPREIELYSYAPAKDITIQMRMIGDNDSDKQFIYYQLTREEALIFGRTLTDFAHAASPLQAEVSNG